MSDDLRDSSPAEPRPEAGEPSPSGAAADSGSMPDAEGSAPSAGQEANLSEAGRPAAAEAAGRTEVAGPQAAEPQRLEQEAEPVGSPDPVESEASPAADPGAAADGSGARAGVGEEQEASGGEGSVSQPGPLAAPIGNQAGGGGAAAALAERRLRDAPAEQSSAGFLLAWVRRQPFFVAFLLMIVIGGPVLLHVLQRHEVQTAVGVGLAEWRGQLEAEGLPVPFLEGRDVPPPPGLEPLVARLADDLPVGAAHLEVLRAWRSLLQGGAPALAPRLEAPEYAPGREGDWAAALRACVALRGAAAAEADGSAARAQAALARARSELERAPQHLRATLSVAHELLAGNPSQAASRARALLAQGPPPGCEPALRVLRAAADARWIREALSARPATITELRQLPPAAQTAPDALRAGLEEQGPALAELVAPGSGDLERALVLTGLLNALYPSDVREGPLATAWPAVRAALGELLVVRLDEADVDTDALAQLLDAVGRLDPSADLPPSEAYADWHEVLRTEVDRPERLLRFSLRFLEAGHVPAGLEDVLRTHVLERGAAPTEPPRTPGQVLARLLLLETPVIEVESIRYPTAGAGSPAEPPPTPAGGAQAGEDTLEGQPVDVFFARTQAARGEVAAVASAAADLERQLDEALGARRDHAARRLRAQAAFLGGRAHLNAGFAGRAVLARQLWQEYARAARERFEVAREQGYEPRHALLAELARCARALHDERAARAAALERVELLEASAEALDRAAGAAPEVERRALLDLELTGVPAQHQLLDPLRVEAQLDLALAHLPSDLDAAAAACARARALSPHAARLHLVEARLHLARGSRGEARRAVERGIAALRPREDDVRVDLQALRDELAGD